MIILVTGDRNWTDKASIRRFLEYLLEMHKDKLEIVQGGARGADTLAREICEELGITCHTVPADWETYKKAAGPIRNRLMMKKFNPRFVLAFHENLAESKGTLDMVRVSVKNKKVVFHFDGEKVSIL